jgi:hypothetical protein
LRPTMPVDRFFGLPGIAMSVMRLVVATGDAPANIIK